MLQISEHNASMVKKGIINDTRARWLHTKLISFAKDIRANGNKAQSASQIDVWVGLTMHVIKSMGELLSSSEFQVMENHPSQWFCLSQQVCGLQEYSSRDLLDDK